MAYIYDIYLSIHKILVHHSKKKKKPGGAQGGHSPQGSDRTITGQSLTIVHSFDVQAKNSDSAEEGHLPKCLPHHRAGPQGPVLS